MSIKISFVLLTWNRKVFLERCLPELVNSIQNKHQCELIIMDNSSSDGSQKFIREFSNEFGRTMNIRFILNEKNGGINAYKKLFDLANGEYIVELDDDVIEFPNNIDNIFVNYLERFNDFGFLALNVIQNELTNGSKPAEDNYKDYIKGDMIVQKGPTGGWCAGFRKKQFKLIRPFFKIYNLNFKFGEDGFIQLAFKLLGLKSGIIKNYKCLHASGPEYSKLFNLTGRDIEKYTSSGMSEMANKYK